MSRDLRSDCGFSLIELMVVIGILAFLVALGVPSYRMYVLNTRIRNTSESIQNGLRNARMAAIQQDANVRFELTGSTSANWTICILNPSTATSCSGGITVQSWVSTAGTYGVTLGSTTSPNGPYSSALTSLGANNGVTFTPLGRPATNALGATTFGRLDVSSGVTGSRWLVNTVSANGQARMCDPQLSQTTSPQGC